MMFNPIQIETKIVAYEKKIDAFHIVYGTRHMKRSDLSVIFPDYQFSFVKQEHGKNIVKSKLDFLQSADAHWTDQIKQALVVQTADCLPIMLMKDSVICSIHAGWRGVYKKIVIEALKEQPVLKSPNLFVSVGPHILQENFEVDVSVSSQILSSSFNPNVVIKTKDGKYKISLIDVLKSQIQSELHEFHFDFFNKNTYSCELFHSFRRDQKINTGQYSFVVRTS